MNLAVQHDNYGPRSGAAFTAVSPFTPVIEIRAIAIITIANSEAGT